MFKSPLKSLLLFWAGKKIINRVSRKRASRPYRGAGVASRDRH